MEYGVEHLERWALVWEQASCLCSAYSLQPKTKKERAKQQPQVWPVCRMPGLLSGWQPPTHKGYTAVICWEEMLEIPNSTDRAHVTWNEEAKSLLQFAYVMLCLGDDGLQVLLSGWNLHMKMKTTLPGAEQGGLTETSCKCSLKQICTFSVVSENTTAAPLRAWYQIMFYVKYCPWHLSLCPTLKDTTSHNPVMVDKLPNKVVRTSISTCKVRKHHTYPIYNIFTFKFSLE